MWDPSLTDKYHVSILLNPLLRRPRSLKPTRRRERDKKVVCDLLSMVISRSFEIHFLRKAQSEPRTCVICPNSLPSPNASERLSTIFYRLLGHNNSGQPCGSIATSSRPRPPSKPAVHEQDVYRSCNH